MDYERLTQDLKQVRRFNQRLSLWVGLLAAGHLLALLVILGLAGRERTIVVPPSLEKSFWVSGNAVSREYLEQMGAFVAWLVLDVSPASITWKTDTLLAYVEPGQYAALKTRMELETRRLQRLNASTSFQPQQLAVNEAQQQVVIRGRLRTWVNTVETSNAAKAYRVQFRYGGGRIQLSTFEEVPYVPEKP
ncbi:type IV conjugative transfer system protein TraE [Xanthomonas hortorum]|uniref:Type IV conjugative transfer system protein TraE n=1 Tax=Xanthomonas hortorum pv. hederae TaxID=453603 RepID=A0A9X4BQN8_9XANT|nr:type IV conjugative transfer system protein TraE [Xanthomonas hortorum]MCE4369672.1 type IV conjugative transfer system protein TraE [Xanthomonas hortorum pv. hederae]MDC8637170.1 type IV conjugative transfer system protein TraE [Xanthomonas hortorum pv. hederae]PPU86214.1 type IV conjugative transfer system protein TraE [Xanthomonas hortorum pv. hederae]PUF01277.1 type IV conjugative transfer system protein TraE [Xanthomonas hortorum pv. hederae]